VIAPERDDPLEAEDVRPLGLRDVPYPREEFLRIELAADERDRRHRRIVPVVVMVVMVMAVLVIVIVVVVVIMVVIVFLEEFGIEREDAIEVERPAIKHAVERDGAALRAMDRGVRVDLADDLFDLGEFLRRDE